MHTKQFSLINYLGRKNMARIFLIIAVLLSIIITLPAFGQDPTGAKTGTISDIDTTTAKSVDSIAQAKSTTSSDVK